MPRKLPPNRTVKRLLTKDVVAAFGSFRKTCDALGLTIQAVHRWEKYVPNTQVYHLLDVKPELRAKVIEEPVKYKLVKRTVEVYVKA